MQLGSKLTLAAELLAASVGISTMKDKPLPQP
jgi:hypothetical protein